MKSQKKLVGALLISALTVSSVYPAEGDLLSKMRECIPNSDQMSSALGRLVKSVGDSKVAKTVAKAGRKVRANPKKAIAGAVVLSLGTKLGWDYWQNRNAQLDYLKRNPQSRIVKDSKMQAFHHALRRQCYYPVIRTVSYAARSGYNSVRARLEAERLDNWMDGVDFSGLC